MSWPFALSTSLASPAGDYLRDPLGAFQTVLAHLRDLLSTWGPIAGPVLIAGALWVGGTRLIDNCMRVPPGAHPVLSS